MAPPLLHRAAIIMHTNYNKSLNCLKEDGTETVWTRVMYT